MVDDQNVVETVEEEVIEAPEAVEDGQAVVEEPAEVEPVSGNAKLTVKRGGVETDTEFPFTGTAIIGRFDPAVGPIDVGLADLPEGSYVSRKHAKVWLDEGVWKIADLGSSNGTFVLRSDFERVDEAEINDGDEIALGNARFVFHTL